VREEDEGLGGREAGAHSTTPTYTVRRDGPAREPSCLAFWLQLDLKMPLENGRANERVAAAGASP
jgi:hypothetical protein